MTSGHATSGHMTQRMVRLIRTIPILSLVSLSIGCGSDTPGATDGATSASSGVGTTGATTGMTASDTSSASSSTGTVATTSSVGGTVTSGGTQGTTAGGTSGTTGTGGATSTGVGGNTGVGGASTASTGGTGGATSSSTGSGDACTYECVEQCVAWGGTEQPGVCDGAQQCCEGATVPIDNPLAHLRDSAEQVGLLLANRFAKQQLAFSSVANLPGDGYKTACEWYGALAVANLTNSQDLLNTLVTKFDPLKTNFVQDMFNGDAHVDRYIFGMVPLEIYLQIGDDTYRDMGTQVADRQQTTNQTRGAIDDMFMMTGLQLEAYRATGADSYIDFMSSTMVTYLAAQKSNGLFYHNDAEAPVHWGRGNGWFAAGMAEMMRDLPKTHDNYATIEAGYKRMMEGLVAVQGDNGLWYQVLDMPDNPSNWEESSGSAMFTYAMIAGVRRGILDADTYVPVIDAAWAGLQTKINAQGDVSDICTGTWYHATAQEYMALTRLTGDGHGQAPVLWAAAELLR